MEIPRKRKEKIAYWSNVQKNITQHWNFLNIFIFQNNGEAENEIATSPDEEIPNKNDDDNDCCVCFDWGVGRCWLRRKLREGNEKTTNDGEFKPRRRVDSQNNSE